jgi:carboxypeptidase Taq
VTVDDVPRLWAEKMKQYLGLDLSGSAGSDVAADRTYADGCMQDIHWAVGYLGYFPTYTIGAVLAAQFMAGVRKDLGDAAVDDAIAQGDVSLVRAWLKEKVWSRGSLVPTEQLIVEATGEPLTTAHYRRHLENRYLPKA